MNARPALRQRHSGLLAATLLICGLALLPAATLIGLAITGGVADWPHLLANVIPGAALTTAILLALVAAGTSAVGVAAAWAVVGYEFPARKVLSWALVLPLAVPPYLAAYAFGEFFTFTGPVQGVVRALFGFQSARDYWFPDIRSTPGAAFVLASVLYPYVYLTARVVFLMQGRNIADVARTLGARPATVFWRVLLPAARPALAAGLALVMMETLNDIGASEYLGVRTLTFAVFTTWLNRGSLAGAAQIATLMLAFVVALLFAEQWARRRQRFHAARGTQLRAHPPRVRLSRGPGALLALALLVPVLLGFGIPLGVFGFYVLNRLDQLFGAALASAFLNSVVTGAATATLTVALALFLLNALRLCRTRPAALAARLAMAGYALPGTILGLGLLFALARIDNSVDAASRALFGVSTGLILTGSAAGIVIACTIRFLALAEGAVRSGLEKLPPHVDEAARTLGRSAGQSARQILLPLLKPAILTAAVLVFIDTIKELSATILLRPFGFNTLATLTYENASRGVVQDGAAAALLIIVAAAVPVMLLTRALARDGAARL